ncbi:MAG: N-acetyltransferase [Pseudomonadota bacterium]
MEDLDIRESAPSDLAALEMLYPDAFPDEDLLPVVRELLRDVPTILSLVAIIDGDVVGHVIFTTCTMTDWNDTAALLGPLGVASNRQKQGIGSALVKTGLRRLEMDGVRHVMVLGDPGYYGRFGFVAESHVPPPYELPAEWDGAWQSLRLGGADRAESGKLQLPKPWMKPALWLP